MFGRNENPKGDKDAAALDDLSLSSPVLPGTKNKTPSSQVSQEHSNLWTNPHKRARDWLKRKHEAKQGGVFVHHSTIREKIHREIEHVKGLFKAANKPEPTSEEIIVYYDAGHPRESPQAQAQVAEVAEVASEEIMFTMMQDNKASVLRVLHQNLLLEKLPSTMTLALRRMTSLLLQSYN